MMNATLYKFRRDIDGKVVQVVRLTDSVPDDWHMWGEQFAQQHPEVGAPSGIYAIDVVDDRGPVA